MSRIGVALLVMLCWTTTGLAQSAQEQARVVDSLRVISANAFRRLSQFDDSVRAMRLANDTVIARPFRLLVEEPLAALVAKAVPGARQQLLESAGSAAARIEDVFLVIRSTGDTLASAPLVTIHMLGPTGEGRGHLVASDTAALASGIAHVSLQTIAGMLDSWFVSWMGGEARWDSVSTNTWSQSRLLLVDMPDRSGQPCFTGNLASCGEILGLAGGPDPAAPALLRATLFRTAMTLGGEGAFERMMQSSGTPAQRIATIAAVPADSVVTVWRGRLRGARNPSDAMNGSIAAMSLFWIAVCGALSLRSTRWR